MNYTKLPIHTKKFPIVVNVAEKPNIKPHVIRVNIIIIKVQPKNLNIFFLYLNFKQV